MKTKNAIMLLVFCNLFWAGNFIVSQVVMDEITPFDLTYIRWLASLVFLFIIAQIIEKPDWKHAAKNWKYLLGMGISGIILYNLFLYSALTLTSSINASIVTALNPGLLVLLSAIILKERITKIQTIGVFVSLFGVLVVITEGNIFQILSVNYNAGDLIMILAILAWSGYSIFGKMMTTVKPITATALSSTLGVLIMTPFAIREGIPITSMSMQALIGILFIVLFPSLGSYIFWNVGVKSIGASRSGVFLNLIPVFTALISTLLGNPATMVQIIGGLFVFTGVYMTTGMLERRLNKYQTT
ncbi:MAG: DMT family transporter [Tindallia sp. MSAO_Bac2]|nr:MAG: DMT family transporter [Tindallia sp. MSAO_Bac2]